MIFTFLILSFPSSVGFPKNEVPRVGLLFPLPLPLLLFPSSSLADSSPDNRSARRSGLAMVSSLLQLLTD